MLEVVAGVIVNENKEIYICQRPKGLLKGKWEFPGGKVEINETLEEALIREMWEELSCDIRVESYIGNNKHDYSEFSVNLHLFKVKVIKGTIKSNEHMDEKWIKFNDIKNIDFAEADIPLLEKISNKLA